MQTFEEFLGTVGKQGHINLLFESAMYHRQFAAEEPDIGDDQP